MATALQKFWQIPAAAAEVGVDARTLHFAIKRGELTPVPTGCGTGRLLSIEEVRSWAKPAAKQSRARRRVEAAAAARKS